MIQGYIKTKEQTLTACLQKMQNQYDLISPDTNWNDYNNPGEAHGRWTALWPRCMGDASGTKMNQCEETGDYLFNIELTNEQLERLIDVPTTPVFDFQYEGELDEHGERLLPPTFKRKVIINDVWTGGYFDVTITRMQ